MIKLVKSTFYRESETQAALSDFILKVKQLSFGEQCRAFESNFAKYQQREDCVVVNSGSSANLAVIQAMLNIGLLKKGDKVGFSAVTWSTNVMPLVQLGLVPIPVDVELETLNVSSQKLRETLSKHRLKMLFLTNLLGLCHDIDEIADLCVKKNVLLIEDNCESLGSVYKGKKLGNFGLASTFSFYVGHQMSTIEGGAVCTDYEELAEAVRLVRAHGWDRNLDQESQERIRDEHRVNSSFYSRYTFYDLGYNLRPTEITGFLGNAQLKLLDEIVQRRQDNFRKFGAKVYTKKNGFFPYKSDHMDTFSSFAFPLVCKTQAQRKKIVDACEGKVESRPIVGGNMAKQPFYKKYINGEFSRIECPNADVIHKQGLYVGNNPELTEKEIKTLVEVVLG